MFLSPVPLVYYWCSQVVLFPQKATARVQGACSARPIETSCCCWFFAEHPSAAPAASCLQPSHWALTFYPYSPSMPLLFRHFSSLREVFFVLSLAFIWEQPLAGEETFSKWAFFFFFFFFRPYKVATVGWILYKTAVSLARKQGRSSVLHGNEDISVNNVFHC